MRDFSFSVGCVSHSSIDVIHNHAKKSRTILNSTLTSEEESKGKIKNPFPPLPMPNISSNIQKVVKRIKNLSYIFQFYKEEKDDSEEEEDEREMVIGLPTDVQHVAHIGWDEGKDRISFPNLSSLRQFEHTMVS